MTGKDRIKQIGYIGLIALAVTIAFHLAIAVLGLVLGGSWSFLGS